MRSPSEYYLRRTTCCVWFCPSTTPVPVDVSSAYWRLIARLLLVSPNLFPIENTQQQQKQHRVFMVLSLELTQDVIAYYLFGTRNDHFAPLSSGRSLSPIFFLSTEICCDERHFHIITVGTIFGRHRLYFRILLLL
jgi:hypothetical protein